MDSAEEWTDERRDEMLRSFMDGRIEVKRWVVPAHEDKGPVTIELRLPEVRVTDSEGRFILLSPRQSELVGSRISSAGEWVQDFPEDYPED